MQASAKTGPAGSHIVFAGLTGLYTCRGKESAAFTRVMWKWGRKTSKPIYEDEKIREVLTEVMEGYLKGGQSLEDTIQKAEDGLKMYLAE